MCGPSDWRLEKSMKNELAASQKLVSRAHVIAGLLNPATEDMITLSSEYSRHYAYYDMMAKNVHSNIVIEERFRSMTNTVRLLDWQADALNALQHQSDYQILWIQDAAGGGIGKSWFASFLETFYGYSVYDGMLSTSDMALIFKPCKYCYLNKGNLGEMK